MNQLHALFDSFKNKKLLEDALTHPSFAHGKKNNSFERLEFLGDRVLGIVIADALYKKHPSEKEGLLAKRFAKLVSKETCKVAFLNMKGNDFLKANERELQIITSNIYSDACEALLGAIYLDQGFKAVKEFIIFYWNPFLNGEILTQQDDKTKLQEWVQKKYNQTPVYELIKKTGTDHEPLFHVSVTIPNYPPSFADGPTRRIAEKNAAHVMLKILKL